VKELERLYSSSWNVSLLMSSNSLCPSDPKMPPPGSLPVLLQSSETSPFPS
jgi:hypothetical protein